MMVLRFMSANEIIRLVDGQLLHNDVVHAESSAANTTSVGFCFAIINPKLTLRDSIYAAAQYLSGVVTMDVCLVGRLKEPMRKSFKKTQGVYSAGALDEISTKEYSLEDFKTWKLFTPELPPADFPFKIIGSPNWRFPKLAKDAT